MSADNLGKYAYNPSIGMWVCWMAFMSDDDQRPYGAIVRAYDTEAECVDYFRKDEESGTYYEYGWGGAEWLGYYGDAYPEGSKQWLADQIDQTAQWLDEQRGEYVSAAIWGELDVKIKQLKEYANQIRYYHGH